MELLNILRVLRRWWLLIVLLPLVSAVILWWGLRSRPPMYKASVKLQITTPQREDVAVYEEYRYGSLRDEIAVARNNFVEVLQSKDVRNQTARQLDLNDKDREFSIDINTVSGADFAYVTVEAGSPTLAAEIASTLVDAAIAYYGDLRARPTYAERDLFAEKLRTAEEVLRSAQDRFAQFQAENGAVSLEEQLHTYERLLEQLQLERDRLLLEETTRVVDPISEVDRLIAQHQQELDRLAALVPAYNLLQEDVQVAREDYQRISAQQDGGAQGGEGQPAEETLIALEELRAAEAALADFETQQGIVSLESELQTYQRLLEQLQLERDRLLLEETTRSVDAVSQVDQLIVRRQQERDRLSALVPEYDLLSEDLLQAREQYSYILNKYTEAELTAAAVRAANFIQIVEPAQPPTEPVSNAAVLLLLTTAASAGVAVVLAFLLEYVSAAVDDSISLDEGDGQSVLGLPVLGRVPSMTNGLCEPDSQEAEAVRQLRTRLLVSSPGGQLKTLLVTSPQPEDGKSVVAANLGAAMAASGARVVLVDADLRAPGLHQWFDQPNLAGLADWLKAEDSSLEHLLLELVRDTHIPGLSLVAAGPAPQDPSLLLASDQMGAAVQILSEHFDRVVLDGPPVIVAPDALVLARLVQSTLLVLSPDHTSRRSARQAIGSLTSGDDIRIIGTALNRTSLNSYGYYSYGRRQKRAQKVVQQLSALPLLRRWKDASLISTSVDTPTGELTAGAERGGDNGESPQGIFAAVIGGHLAGLFLKHKGIGWVVVAALALTAVLIGLAVLLSGRGTSAATLPMHTLAPILAPTATWISLVAVLPTDTSLPTATPSRVPAKEPSPTPCPYPAEWEAYEVQARETLSELALRHNLSVADVVEANCLTSSDILSGQTVYLPVLPPTLTPAPSLTATASITPTAELSPTGCIPPEGWTMLHVVEVGDNLYSLALAHGVTVEEIMEANCLESTSLSAGRQQLYLPPMPEEGTASPTSSFRSTEVSTRSSPQPTGTASASLPAPVLVAPADGTEFPTSGDIVLAWQPVEGLPADAFYMITVAYSHEGETWYDDVPWTRDTAWTLSEHNYLLDLSDDGRFTWWVQVVRQSGTGADGSLEGQSLSEPSGSRRLSWRLPAAGGGGTQNGTPSVPPP